MVTKINDSYFNKINSNSAYILGFMLADAGVFYKGYKDSNFKGEGYNISINLHQKDIEILEFIKSEISPSNKIYQYDYITPSDGIRRLSCRLVLSNKKLVESVMSFGINPNKTGKEYLPTLDQKYYPDLLRGFFDGDGSIYIGKQFHKNKEYFKGNLKFVSASLQLLSEIKLLLNNVGSKINSITKDNCYRYQIQSKKDILDVYNYMYYNDNVFCLQRKKEIFKGLGV